MRITAAKGTAHAGLLFPQILTAPQSIAAPQVTAPRLPASVATPPNGPAPAPVSGVIEEAKRMPGVTVDIEARRAKLASKMLPQFRPR